uniref:Uncharacterized protein n=1 Tax=uncultured Verrucomicrobiales bacterium HF0200_39L05 TaxID=710997 RepID=E0XUR1_9BACT|nr:hypothetical protein [uncultured Verrucomicrobiales bacterium HF0200_39L05]
MVRSENSTGVAKSASAKICLIDVSAILRAASEQINSCFREKLRKKRLNNPLSARWTLPLV